MKWLTRFGCLSSIILAALVSGLLFATDMGRYILIYLGALVGVTVGLERQKSDYAYVKATVVEARISEHSSIGSMGTLTLDYRDERGGSFVEMFRVSSASSKLAKVKPGDTLEVSVCRHDPRIIKSFQFTVRDAAPCVAAGAQAADRDIGRGSED